MKTSQSRETENLPYFWYFNKMEKFDSRMRIWQYELVLEESSSGPQQSFFPQLIINDYPMKYKGLET